jgi:hypothetical protein
VEIKRDLRVRFLPILVLIFAIFGGLFAIFQLQNSARAAESGDFAQITNIITDPETYRLTDNFTYSKLMNGRIWTDKSVTTNSRTFYDNEGVPLATVSAPKNDDFLVTLSALSQSYSVEQLKTPVDTIFVIDLSSSMSAYGISADAAPAAGEQYRDQLLVSALNRAISQVLAASPDNRIAVVGYSGTSTYNLLNLAHYQTTAQDGDGAEIYFNLTISGGMFATHDLSVNSGVSAANPAQNPDYSPLIIGCGSLNGDGTDDDGLCLENGVEISPENLRNTDGNANARVAVSGGTNTQMGLVAGGNILENADTEFLFDDNGVQRETTRKPILIMMTDGDPTYGWLEYGAKNLNSGNFDAGNGNPATGDIGTDFLTILTATEVKNRVNQHYYPNDENAMTVYTLGVGANSAHARAVMNPAELAQNVNCAYGAAGGWGGGNNCSATSGATNYNLKTLLDNFSAQQNTTFPLNAKNSNTNWTLQNLAADPTVRNYAYTDGYYPAQNVDELNDAFDEIAQNIITKGGYVTVPGDDPNTSGYITFSDLIGYGLEFREAKGIFVDGELWYGANFACLISQGEDYIDISECPSVPPGAQNGEENLAYDHYVQNLATRLNISEAAARAILDANIAAGNIYYNSADDFSNSIKYYVDLDTEFVENYYNADGSRVFATDDEAAAQNSNIAAVVDLRGFYVGKTDEISGQETNLDNIFASVTTALHDGEFTLRGTDYAVNLSKTQQGVRWYIPAALIPTRTVATFCGYGDDAYQMQLHDDDSTPDIDESTCTNQDDIHIDVAGTIPIRLNFTVGLRADFDLENINKQYLNKYCRANFDANPNSDVPNAPGDTEVKCTDGFYFYSNDWDAASDAAQIATANGATLSTFTPAPDNPYYYFNAVSDIYEKSGEDYVLAQDFDQDAQYYYLEEFFDSRCDGSADAPAHCVSGSANKYLAREYIPLDLAITKINQTTMKIPAAALKTHPSDESNENNPSNSQEKTENSTESYSFVRAAQFDSGENGQVDDKMIYYLGNNGRLEIVPTGLKVAKIWREKSDEKGDYYVQLYRDGEPYRNPVSLDDFAKNSATEWDYSFDNLLIYDVTKEDSPRYNYSVKEGSCDLGDDGICESAEFSAFGAQTDDGKFAVKITQPTWNDNSATDFYDDSLNDAKIENTESDLVCEYNSEILASDANCQPPCEYNSDLLANDPNCVPEKPEDPGKNPEKPTPPVVPSAPNTGFSRKMSFGGKIAL